MKEVIKVCKLGIWQLEIINIMIKKITSHIFEIEMEVLTTINKVDIMNTDIIEKNKQNWKNKFRPGNPQNRNGYNRNNARHRYNTQYPYNNYNDRFDYNNSNKCNSYYNYRDENQQ